MNTNFKGSKAIDAILALTAQKIEHYDIASNGGLHKWAILLKNSNKAEVLESSPIHDSNVGKLLVGAATSKSHMDALAENENNTHSQPRERAPVFIIQ